MIILLAACVVAVAQDLPKIAVYVTGDVPGNEKEALGTRMLATLVNSGRYIGIERSNTFLAEIEKEHIKQRSGAIDDSQISELGKQFGVKFVCIVAITPAFGEFQVSARIVNVETAVVVHIGEAFSRLQTPHDLLVVSDKVVENMFGWKTKSAQRPEFKREPAAVSQAEIGTYRTERSVRGNRRGWAGTNNPAVAGRVARRNSAGVLVGFGNAINLDGQLTLMVANNQLRQDWMVGYCGGFKYEYKEGWDFDSSIKYITKDVSALELVYAVGWPIDITGAMAGYVSMASAIYIDGQYDISIYDMGIGCQAGGEYVLEDFVIGIYFRLMYYCLLGAIDYTQAPGFRFTIGLSGRYRI